MWWCAYNQAYIDVVTQCGTDVACDCRTNKPKEKTMQLEAGKRYKTREGHTVFIMGVDHTGERWHGYIVRYSFDIYDSMNSVYYWASNGKFHNTEDENQLDLVEEHIDPKSGQVKLWVYYSSSFGDEYRTSYTDREVPHDDVSPDAKLICTQIVDWKEDGTTGE